MNRAYEHINNLYQGVGSYSYDYSWDFIADYLHATTGLGGSGYTGNFYSFTQGIGNPSIAFSTTDYAGYLTDDWRITPASPSPPACATSTNTFHQIPTSTLATPPSASPRFLKPPEAG